MIVRLIIGIIGGGIMGYGMYYFIGCETGTCPLTSNPWISTVLGMALGAFISGAF